MKQPVFEQTGYPRFPMMPKFEMDSNYAMIQIFVLESNNDFAQITMKKDDVRRLKLMVDDFIRIRLIPLKPGESASSQDHSAGDNDVAIVRAEIGHFY